jgi:hypothetical protein
MINDDDLYRQINAVHGKDFHTCFYCGCIATKTDFVPPIKYAEFYLKAREDADFYKVPSCQECFEILRADKSALLGQRVDNVKKKLARKYQKAVRVYEMWDEDELEELDYSLNRSIKAGLYLGKESYDRVKFRGFEFEADGDKHSLHFYKKELITVFGQQFTNFRDALDYGSKAFRIPKAKLRDLFMEHNNSFDDAIKFFQAEMARKLFEKELKEKSKPFAVKYKQSPKFVMHTVEIYLGQDERLTIDTALAKLWHERIKNLYKD